LRAENIQDTQNAATEFATSPKNTSVTSDSSAVFILLQHLHKSRA